MMDKRMPEQRLASWRSALPMTLLLLGALVFPARSSWAQEPRPILSYITSDAFLGLVARTGAIAELPEMELFPREIISAMSQKDFALDAMQIEEVLVFSEPPARGKGEPICFVVRFKKGADLSSAFSKWAEDYLPETLAGKKLLAPKRYGQSILLADAQTLLVGDKALLEKVIAERSDKPRLTEKLEALRGKHHVAMVAFMAPIRPLVNEQVTQSPPPSPFSMFTRLPELVDQLDMHFDVGAKGGLTARLESASNDSAEQVEIILKAGMEMGKQAALSQLRQLDPSDPLQEAAIRYARRAADHIEAQWKPRRAGNEVTLELKTENATPIAAAGTLTALLLPAVQSAREAAQRMNSANNLKQIALAMHNYHSTHRTFPAQASKDAAGKPLLSWRVHILPYIDEQALYEQFHLDEPWDSEHNLKLLDKMPKLYRSPKSPHANRASYLVPMGEGTTFADGEAPRLENILDGTSNTILVVEANNDSAVPWTKPEDYSLDFEDPMKGLLGIWEGGFQVALCDGSVRFIAETVDLWLLKALLTSAGGEAIPIR